MDIKSIILISQIHLLATVNIDCVSSFTNISSPIQRLSGTTTMATNNNNNEEPPSSWSIQNSNDIQTSKSKLHVWPLDEYNVKLLNEVHPKNWSNNVDDDAMVYDLIALGAGAGGLVSSRQVSLLTSNTVIKDTKT